MISGLKGLRWPATLKTLMFLGIFEESFVFLVWMSPGRFGRYLKMIFKQMQVAWGGVGFLEGDNKEVNPSIDRFFGVMGSSMT